MPVRDGSEGLVQSPLERNRNGNSPAYRKKNGLLLRAIVRFLRAPEAGAQPNRGESPTGAENSQDGGLAVGCAPAPGARERASVFWHALSPSNSLLLTWENALVGRDPNSPTNLQAELYADGRFAWRTDGDKPTEIGFR